MAYSANVLYGLFSLAAVVIAAFFAISPNSQYPLINDSTYCYDHITTLSESLPKATCFSVSSNGYISKVYGSLKDVPSNYIKSSGAVIPGLWDGHGHVLQLGELLQTVNLFGSASMDDALERVATYVKHHPGAGSKDNWIKGTGWDQAKFGRMPIADDFEKVISLKGKYIMLNRVDVHCVWVSNAVLQLLPDPLPTIPGGEIITDPGKGVFCDNAIDLVMEHSPKPTDEKRKQYIKAAMTEMNRVGLVGVHEAGVFPSEMDLYNQIVDTENWTARIYAMLECEKRNTFCEPEANRMKTLGYDEKLMIKSVKLFADGALGSWGSALIEPYSDHPNSRGSLLINGTVLTEVAQKWAKSGYQVNIHAIGDLANRLVVDAFTASYPLVCPEKSAKDCQKNRRFRIEHSQIIHPDDQARIFDLGIIPSIQPGHATSDMSYAETRLGHQRTLKEAYRLRTFLPLHPVLGSDFPVEPANPFHGMYAAITRKDPKTGKGKDGADKGWFTEETLNATEALLGYTKNPAYGAFLEGKAGIIQEGALADWLVLDRPFEDLQPEDLLTLQVKETWMGGKMVYPSE